LASQLAERRNQQGAVHSARRQGEEDPTLGWDKLLPGRVAIFDVPGDHRTIVKRGAEAMAARLRELMAD